MGFDSGLSPYQYDDGQVSGVTDLDGDGAPEVWLSGSEGECDGEGLRPGLDCAVEVIHMGEVVGDALSYFSDRRQLAGERIGSR